MAKTGVHGEGHNLRAHGQSLSDAQGRDDVGPSRRTGEDPFLGPRFPILVITGERSADASTADIGSVAAALPDARILRLEAQAHVADILEPELFTERVLPFLLSGS